MAQEDLHCDDKRVILKIRETDDLWIFEAGIPGMVSYGGRNMISINKATGEIKLFALPNKENFDILHTSRVIYEYNQKTVVEKDTNTYFKGRIPSKEIYERLSVEELKSIYQKIIENNYSFSSKEEQLKHLFENFSVEANYVTRDFSKKTIEDVLKEKTGEEYKIETKTYEISLNDLINYTVKDPFFAKSISDFLNKLDNVSEEDKRFFIISLYHDKNSFNEFTREISNLQDANAIYEKYKNKGIEYELNHELDAYIPPNGRQ